MNTPYRKIYENGILTNPITKQNSYLVDSRPNKRKIRLSNNHKGNGLVVTRVGILTFVKYQIVKQVVKNRLIINSILKK